MLRRQPYIVYWCEYWVANEMYLSGMSYSTATTNSRLAFTVHDEQATSREPIGHTDVNLYAVMQKHRGKSMY